MTLRDENYWLSVKPLAESNQRMWIRQIQSDALAFAAAFAKTSCNSNHSALGLRAMADALKDQRDDYSALKPAPNG